MAVYKAYKFRIFPNKERYIQQVRLEMTYHTCSSELPRLKEELPWLKEMNSVSIQSSVKNLVDAYTRFYKIQNEVGNRHTALAMRGSLNLDVAGKL